MNGGSEQFPFVIRDPAVGLLSSMPVLPLILERRGQSLTTSGLVDSASVTNVLPYSIGVQLGLDWDQQTVSIELTGNLASLEAKGVFLTGVVGSFSPVTLAFAWASSDLAPLLLGQVNFFAEFDVCLFRSRGVFEVRHKQTP